MSASIDFTLVFEKPLSESDEKQLEAHYDRLVALLGKLDRLRSENAVLREALKPFAELREKLGEQAVQMADDGEAVKLVVKFASRKEGFDFTFAHVLRAREALAESAGPEEWR